LIDVLFNRTHLTLCAVFRSFGPSFEAAAVVSRTNY